MGINLFQLPGSQNVLKQSHVKYFILKSPCRWPGAPESVLGICHDQSLSWPFLGSNVMRSIHGVGELMTQVVLRGGGFLPMTPTAAAPEGNVKQAEPEKEDIMVMDTKLKIIEILQVTMCQGRGQKCACRGTVFLQCPCLDGALGFLGREGRPQVPFLDWPS